MLLSPFARLLWDWGRVIFQISDFCSSLNQNLMVPNSKALVVDFRVVGGC